MVKKMIQAQESKIDRIPEKKEYKEYKEIDLINNIMDTVIYINDNITKRDYVCRYIKLIKKNNRQWIEIDLKG